MNVTFPSGVWFAPSDSALVESLFSPSGTASGTYKQHKDGVMFYRGNGNPWFFLVANRYNERFFVSCYKRETDGRTVYMFAMDSATQSILGLGKSYREDHELAESIFESINSQSVSA